LWIPSPAGDFPRERKTKWNHIDLKSVGVSLHQSLEQFTTHINYNSWIMKNWVQIFKYILEHTENSVRLPRIKSSKIKYFGNGFWEGLSLK